MPRRLPWKTAGPTNVIRAKRSSSTPSSTPKRLKVEKTTDKTRTENNYEKSDVDNENRASSPIPMPPTENLMYEGIDHDDMWRMVEDEFLTVAQHFTAHLHAAEYKRQRKAVKSRNVDVISSISRPVTGKMPDHTRRKLDNIARAKAQKGAIEGLYNKEADIATISDSDDEVGLPYVGTTLHGLMDGPRRKAALLTKLTDITKSTRAAAGFQKSAILPTPIEKSILLVQPRQRMELGRNNDEMIIAPSGEDDDLDTSFLIPRTTEIERESTITTTPSAVAKCGHTSTIIQSRLDPTKDSIISASFSHINIMPRNPTQTTSIRQSPERRPGRLELARRRKAKEAKQKSASSNLDVIPTFL